MVKLKTNKKPNNLLFAEMILALLFFVVSFTVIIRVFAGADGLEREQRRREQAGLVAQSAAEAYSVSGDVQQAVKLALGCGVSLSDGRCELSLAEDFTPSDSGEITLVLEEKQTEQSAVGRYSELLMTFLYSGEDFYALQCGAYIPMKGDVAHFD